MPLPRLAAVMAILALIGFSDAMFLTVEHFRGAVPPCIGVSGCAAVTTSSYSYIFKIPVALLGAFYYLCVLLGTVSYFDSRRDRLLRHTAFLTPLGFAFSLWFVYVQAFILHAFCTWCLLSAFTSTLLFVMGMLVLRHHKTLREKIASILE